MDAHDDAVAWVHAHFDDPTYDVDARVRAQIARDPGFAEVVKEMITRSPAGLPFRVDISRPRDPEMETVQALERLNGRLHLIGVQAVSVEGEPGTTRGCIWRVRVPQSHEEYVRFLVSGRYGVSSGPDGEALSTEVEELEVGQLATLRQCFAETREHVQAGLARLQGEDLPQLSASPLDDMLHYVVQQAARSLEGHLSRLAYMDEVMAREQARRSTRPEQG